MVAHDINIQAMRHAPTEIQNKVGNDRITKNHITRTRIL